MRELNNNEIQAISGGIDPAFLGGFIAGAAGLSFGKTIRYCALFGAICPILATPQIGIIGFVIAMPICAAIEAVTGCIGFAIGSLFASPEEAKTA